MKMYKIMDKVKSYGEMYECLCTAQYIADQFQDEYANLITKIRQETGNKLLKLHEENAISK